jgi:hypothetical protein
MRVPRPAANMMISRFLYDVAIIKPSIERRTVAASLLF